MVNFILLSQNSIQCYYHQNMTMNPLLSLKLYILVFHWFRFFLDQRIHHFDNLHFESEEPDRKFLPYLISPFWQYQRLSNNLFPSQAFEA